MGYGSYRECLYASTVPGTALATFTTEALLNTPTVMKPQAALPLNFWLPNPAGSNGRGFHILARGILSTTSSAPTFTWTVRLGASGITAPIVLGTTAITSVASQTNQFWELEGDVILESIGAAGGNSTVRGLGMVRSPAGLPTPFCAAAFSGAASPGTVATVDTSIVNFISVNAACGTSSASNTIQLLQLIVEALN